jgi:hypothetical protein
MLTCSSLSIVIPTEDLTELILKGELKKNIMSLIMLLLYFFKNILLHSQIIHNKGSVE